MVLVIEGSPLAKSPVSTQEFYACYPSLVQKGRSFVQREVVRLDPEFMLYVAQGEFGVVSGHDPKVRFVGSDDATTCHIMVLRHPGGSVGVSHFDGRKGEAAALDAMVQKISSIEKDTEGLQVYVVGGYTPEEGSSEAMKNEAEHLSHKILGMLIQHSTTFHLAQWCTCGVNTTQGEAGPRPLVYGVGVEVSTGSVFPASFSSREPNLPLRSASRWLCSDSSLCDLYDHVSGTITIEPFEYSDMSWFEIYLRLPDEYLLHNFSTSPKVEPPQFCRDLREVFKVFVNHPDPYKTLFPDGRSKKFIMNNTGIWEQLAS